MSGIFVVCAVLIGIRYGVSMYQETGGAALVSFLQQGQDFRFALNPQLESSPGTLSRLSRCPDRPTNDEGLSCSASVAGDKAQPTCRDIDEMTDWSSRALTRGCPYPTIAQEKRRCWYGFTSLASPLPARDSKLSGGVCVGALVGTRIDVFGVVVDTEFAAHRMCTVI